MLEYYDIDTLQAVLKAIDNIGSARPWDYATSLSIYELCDVFICRRVE